MDGFRVFIFGPDFKNRWRMAEKALRRRQGGGWADVWRLMLGGVPHIGPAVDVRDREPRPAAVRCLPTVISQSLAECRNSLLGAVLAGVGRTVCVHTDTLTASYVMVQRCPAAP
jgi:hypothetical protein